MSLWMGSCSRCASKRVGADEETGVEKDGEGLPSLLFLAPSLLVWA